MHYEIVGKYGKASITIDTLSENTIQQVYEFLNHQLFINNIAIMPDGHYGSGCVVGFTMPLSNIGIVPNVVGVDGNCGMLSFNVGKILLSTHSRKDIDDIIRENIPIGEGKTHKVKQQFDFNVFSSTINLKLKNFRDNYLSKFNKSFKIPNFDKNYFEELCDKVGCNLSHIYTSIGTLGGGNHFIEVSKDSNGEYWITIHSGSRNLGASVCNYHQKIAIKKNKKKYSIEDVKKIEPDKTKWNEKLIELNSNFQEVSKGLSWLEDQDMYNYFIDSIIVSEYATLNRNVMMDIICEKLNIEKIFNVFETRHNYIDFNDFIIRKGAVNAHKDIVLVIPLNNEDGILFCKGLGNPEWNYSAPHGAGRKHKRSDATPEFSRSALKRMKDNDIYTSYIPNDETKDSYKDPKEIINAIKGTTVDIIDVWKPILNIKGKDKSKKRKRKG